MTDKSIEVYVDAPSSDHFEGPARIYTSKDEKHQVIMPKLLALEIDAIRTFRKLLEPSAASHAEALPFYCVLPEEIFEALQRLPQPGLIKEIVLHSQSSGSENSNCVNMNSYRKTSRPGQINILTPLSLGELSRILTDECRRLKSSSR